MGKVIVVGGSAGSIEPLCTLLRELPAGFPAPVLVVIHVGEEGSQLPQVLQRCTKLKVGSPEQPEPIAPGRVYVAPPNRHLVARDSCVLATTEDENLPVKEPFTYTCPECDGAMRKVDHGGVEQFRCSTGHTFSIDSFSLAHSEALERALWVALQRLNERRSISDELARTAGDARNQRRCRENAAAAAGDMRMLKEILARL
jgi:hypothetical protein